MTSKQITQDEARDKFIAHMWAMVEWWEKEDRCSSTRDRLAGLMHSFFAALDGRTLELPGCQVIPDPHPEDREYHISNGEDYYPDAKEGMDIAGSLCERMYRYAEEHGIRKE